MAKETANSRLPRLAGASHIPLPGHLRASKANENAAQKPASRLTQIMRPPAVAIVAPQKRTVASVSGLKPPTVVVAAVKKSGSGDALNNMMNMMSRKTNTALKKIWSKADKTNNQQLPNVRAAAAAASKVNVQTRAAMVSSTPQPLARSKTFVRDESPKAMLGLTQDILVQSTPAPAKGSWMPSESTHLLDKKPRNLNDCQMNETFQTANEQKNLLLQRTRPVCLESPVNGKRVSMGETVCLNTPEAEQQLGRTHTINTPNLTKNLSAANLIGQTMCVASPLHDMHELQIMQKLRELKAQNLNFGNDSSIENLQMLDDVSLPSGFDLDVTIKSQLIDSQAENLLDITAIKAPDKTSMKLQLNSTANTERLVNLTTPQHDFSKDFMLSPFHRLNQRKNNTQLLYKTPSSASTTPDCGQRFVVGNSNKTPISLSPFVFKNATNEQTFALKCAQSDLLLPTRTPDDELQLKGTLLNMAERTDEFQAAATSLQDVSNPYGKKSRFSFGLDLTESTLDCSIELVDVSLSYTQLANSQTHSLQQQQQLTLLKKQNSMDLDESLGILTPDQMKEFLDSNTHNTQNMELPLLLHNNKEQHKLTLQQIRIDQTPSPEDLPLDTVEVRTDISDIILAKKQIAENVQQQQLDEKQPVQQQQQQQQLEMQPMQQQLASSACNSQAEPHSQHTDTEQMSKSAVSKISTSFITSVTSVTSLDTGYQGDGEMSRPASRGACDHSPSNGPNMRKGAHVSRQPSFNQQQQQQMQLPPVRRQDPMTDSDFFTESDADDIFHRGDRRAQVIDGQLYGPMLQPAASVYISEDPQMEDSCMESSGIFTDVENRCDEDLAQMRRQDTQDLPDMSPDLDAAEADDSTETVKSNKKCKTDSANNTLGQGQQCCSQTSSTIQSSFSNDRLSAATTLSNRTSYCSVDGSCVNVDSKQSCSSLEEAFKSSYANMRQQFVGCSLSSVVANEQSSCKHAASLSSSLSLNNAQELNACVNRLKSEHKSPVLKCGAQMKKIEKAASASVLVESERKANFKSVVTSSPKPQQQQQQQPQQKIARKLHSTNKWEAVMNKIASNKTSVKKNYNDVKSKVSTRLSALHLNGQNSPTDSSSATPSSPSMRRSPTSVSNVSTGRASPLVSAARRTQTPVSAPTAERLLQGVAKRGRSYSKDSQKEAKTPLRAAKKRDVRNLSISPTDLGPPPKTQQTTNGTNSIRAKTAALTTPAAAIAITQKRFTTTLLSSNGSPTPSNASSAVFSALGNSQVSKTPKSSLTSKQRTESTVRSSVKDNNRLNSVAGNTLNSSVRNGCGSKVETSTESHELQRIAGNANNNTSNTLLQHNNHSATTSASPVLATGNRKSFNSSAVLLDKKLQFKPTLLRKVEKPPTNKHTIRQQQHSHPEQHSLHHELVEENFAVTTSSEDSKALLHNAEQQHQNKSVEALGVLLQYAVFELDAFACPVLKKDNVKVKEHLEKTLQLLDEAKGDFLKLQDQLSEKETFYTRREDELQSLHRCELDKAQTNLEDLQQWANQQIAILESKLAARETENKSLKSYHIEQDMELTRKQKQLELAAEREQELKERLSEVEQLANKLSSELKSKESAHVAELQASAERESELKMRLQMLNEEIEALKVAKEQRDCVLRDKLQLTKDEIPLLRTAYTSFNGNSNAKATASPRHSLGTPSKVSNDLTHLQSEIDSLRFVVDMRQDENARLLKQNEELLRDAQDRATLLAKVSSLEYRNEMLKSKLDIKSEREKELLTKIEDLEKTVRHENHQRTRLSYDKEALQYQLKQRSEQLHIVENKLQEISSTNESINLSSLSSSYYNTPHTHEIQDGSPPPSPIVKGVIEKAESVSWVLEMENETAEAAASKLVRRANSVRCGVERSPSLRRQFSANNASTASQLAASNISEGAAHPHPLSLSLSATSVMRHTHSSKNNSNDSEGEASVSANNELIGNRSYPRMRSKSVSVKCSNNATSCTKNNAKQPQASSNNHGGQLVVQRSMTTLGPVRWLEPHAASSPRPRTSTMLKPTLLEEVMIGDSAPTIQKLITCDTAALKNGQRLEMRALATHSSVHDLQALKKRQQIQEFAGEAMLSGANSEDEACSASSDELVPSIASSATSSASLHMKNSNMSLEDELLLDKMNSLNGTPMEMSWSDEVFANAGSSTA